MRLGGWVLMIITWSFIIGMAVFCFSRIFSKGLDTHQPQKSIDRIKKGKT